MSNTRFKILALQIFLIDFIKVQTAINPDNLETICITLKLSGQCWNYLDSNETAQTLSKLIWNCLEIIISTSIHHNFWRLFELPTGQCPKPIWDVWTKLGFLIEYLYNILDSQNLFGLLPGFFWPWGVGVKKIFEVPRFWKRLLLIELLNTCQEANTC